MTTRRALWSTDFDGTLYSGRRGSATIPDSAVACIGEWLAADGWFHVLSGGSMAGMARDGFDLIADVVGFLDAASVPDVEQLVCERVSFSMSNGAEHYHVRSPRQKIGTVQLELDAGLSITVPKREAEAFAGFVGLEFGLSVLAMDTPLGGSEDSVVALFFARNATRAGCGDDAAEQINNALKDIGSAFRIVFVREEERDGLVRQRFDAFPGRAAQFGKLDTAQRIFSNYESVVFTGDQPQGNDRLVFEWMKYQPGMESVFIERPADLATFVIP